METSQPTQHSSNRTVLRFALRESMGLLVMAAALFISAGSLAWWEAWAVLAIMAGWSAATGIVIVRNNPELLAERLGPRRGAKRWDTLIMGSLGLLQLVRYILAGLDQRYDRMAGFSLITQVIAFVICALGYALFVWATASNAYFSQIVRIQSERGHKVVTSGPYRFVRHPGYAGAILYELFVGVLLDSWSVLAVSLVCAVLLVLRTALEDKTLKSELPGYADFASKVRSRLAPGIW